MKAFDPTNHRLTDLVRQGWFALCSLLAVLAIYLEWSLRLREDLFVPNFLGLLLAMAMFPAVRSHKKLVVALSLFAVFCAFNLATTTFGVVPLTKRLKSMTYFTYLFGIATIMVGAGGMWKIPQARRIAAFLFLSAGFTMLGFAALEQRTGLAGVSDAFRFAAYGEIYSDNDKRDVDLLQSVRPKAFTKETSYGARGVSVLLLIGALFSTGALPRVAAFAGVAAAIPIFGSPIPAGFLVAMLYGIWVPRWVKSKGSLLLYFGGLAVAAAVCLAVAVFFSPVLQRRLELVLDSSDSSSYMRMGFMMEMAGKALSLNPVSGVGIGGEDELNSDFLLPLLEIAPTNTLVNNAMWSVPFYTGLFGVFCFGLLMTACAYRLGLRYSVVFTLTILLVLNTTGAIHSSSAWIVGALVYTGLRGAMGNDPVRVRRKPVKVLRVARRKISPSQPLLEESAA